MDDGQGPDAALILAPEAGGGMDSTEQCVPVDALAMPDDGEQLTPPAAGDRVSYQVEGKVTRIDGKNAYVQPETVNGQPIESGKAEPNEGQPPEEDAQQLQGLQDAAQQKGYL